MGRLLIAGGRLDANLGWLADAAHRVGIDCETVLIDPDVPVEFVWQPGDGPPRLGGRRIEATAAFVRYDVFSALTAGSPGAAANAQAWFTTFIAWCALAGLFTFNRDIDVVTGSKLAMLGLARQFGLAVPRTIVSNAGGIAAGLGDSAAFIAKPVAGGSYVMGLDAAIAWAHWQEQLSPSPAMLQPRLSYPERRIYRIGDDFFAFDITASTIDSRLDPKGGIAPLPLDAIPADVLDRLRALTDRLRCDFCAVDMKTDPATGGLVFLELNNGPMFMGYDRTCGGAMAEAMVRYLAAGAPQAAGLGGNCWPGVDSEILSSSSVISAGTSANNGVER